MTKPEETLSNYVQKQQGSLIDAKIVKGLLKQERQSTLSQVRELIEKKSQKAFASYGSHDGIFVFDSGVVAERYPKTMWVFEEQVTPDLEEVVIIKKKYLKEAINKLEEEE